MPRSAHRPQFKFRLQFSLKFPSAGHKLPSIHVSATKHVSSARDSLLSPRPHEFHTQVGAHFYLHHGNSYVNNGQKSLSVVPTSLKTRSLERDFKVTVDTLFSNLLSI